jgi:hypothetical protein
MSLRIRKIIYTLRHKKAFLATELRLTGRITLAGLLHDLDKVAMLMLFMDFDTVNRLHHGRAHHVKDGHLKNIREAIIDWECAAITKPDKPMNARTTYMKLYPHVPGVAEELERLGL